MMEITINGVVLGQTQIDNLTDESKRMLYNMLEASYRKGKRKMTAYARFIELVQIVRLKYPTLTFLHRDRLTTSVRDIIAYKMRLEGFLILDIARLLERDHSSVCQMTTRTEERLKYPKIYPDYVELLELINNEREQEILYQRTGEGTRAF